MRTRYKMETIKQTSISHWIVFFVSLTSMCGSCDQSNEALERNGSGDVRQHEQTVEIVTNTSTVPSEGNTGCDRGELIEKNENWWKTLKNGEMSYLVELERRNRIGEVAPPIVCESECPFDILPGTGLGKVRLGEMKSKYEPYLAIDTFFHETRAEGIFSLSFNEKDVVRVIRINVLDFPEGCLMVRGQPIKRLGSIDEIQKNFVSCESEETIGGGKAFVCEKGKVVVGMTMSGVSISVK